MHDKTFDIMKKTKIIFLFFGLLVSMMSSCVPETTVSFDKTLMYGEWVEGTIHDTYLENGTGYSWDTNDDMTEEEALPFEWSLEQNQLNIIHTLWNGAVVPKTYTVTRLDSQQLVYEDDYGYCHYYERPEPEPSPEPDPS